MTVGGMVAELEELRDSMERDEDGSFAAAALERGVSVREVVRQTVLASRFELALDGAQIGASAVAGRGCFAARDVDEGDLLTFYPGDALFWYPTTALSRSSNTRKVQWAPHVDPTLSGDALARLDGWLEYEVSPYNFGGGAPAHQCTIVGIPELDGDSAYLGHFANDGAALLDGGPSALRTYERESASASNARFESLAELHCAIVATRPIAAGEEVFLSYGAAYWSSRL